MQALLFIFKKPVAILYVRKPLTCMRIIANCQTKALLGSNLCPVLVNAGHAARAQIMLNTHIVIRKSKKDNGRAAAVQ
ncbi:hypothetical protein [Collimonas humicola]|uniref:hypothetical protein n=1 Tax=Collimonas humicola TaxID=2825886 RepID=UPI001B8C1AF1|nr:hypothetical protein [Collimonas humicola]